MPNAFAHIELNTDDTDKAEKFYRAVFAWKLQPMPEVNYTMIETGGTGGGMMKKQDPSQPNAWLPYVEVDDVKKTVAKATKAGATVVLEYQDIGEMGAIGVFVDPTGAPIGVWAKKAPAPKAAKPAAKAAAKAAKPAPKPAPKAAAPAKAAKKKSAKKA